MDAEKRKKVEEMARKDARSGEHTTSVDHAAAYRGQGETYKAAFNEERRKIRKARRRREEGS